MKQYEADALADARIRRVKLWSRWSWLFLFPILGVVLFMLFSSEQHPVVHVHAKPFSCASEAKSLSVLGAGGQIAPLCGQSPYPGDSASDGG